MAYKFTHLLAVPRSANPAEAQVWIESAAREHFVMFLAPAAVSVPEIVICEQESDGDRLFYNASIRIDLTDEQLKAVSQFRPNPDYVPEPDEQIPWRETAYKDADGTLNMCVCHLVGSGPHTEACDCGCHTSRNWLVRSLAEQM